ncbi:MAG: glycine dehydrogenase (aminomethyl-transferring) [Coxiella sp. RIFCSPHIGHO2_12_FULL_42_15]|nr:MAG: glycine dehydrogenase (aminomethyl-transferring) [Coxiella sp. RIFCSPHIGHO2_12_FULL_42_15]
MPFIPHTTEDIRDMLAAIDIETVDQLFDEIPKTLPKANGHKVPTGCSELAISRHMTDMAPPYRPGCCFIGAGAYEHHIPAAVWQLVSRGEFYTAYTPYQAEASQGSLQLIYEYQTMMAALMASDVSNASLYDGSTALAEACLMSVRVNKTKMQRILIPETVHPAYQKVVQTILQQQEIELIPVAMDKKTGVIDQPLLQQQSLEKTAALIIPQPNFLGCLEAVDQLTDWAHANQLLVIAVVNPLAMALLKPPGEWGSAGADIVCGEGQPLGSPLSYGGPYFGFMCCKKQFVRQMPGRLVGRTHDQQGREGYTLTLQAREQHIRRAKATSNICTNQGLLVVAATIYLSLLGQEGLRETALRCHQNALYLREQLAKMSGVKIPFSSPCWHEFVIQIPMPIPEFLSAMRSRGFQAGYPLGENTLLICTTETKTRRDLDLYIQHFKATLQNEKVK